ncbi:hypothetical protein ASZ90_015504 [hydrocarbon metagenome]|uniref:Uncharacterized protein n=1 Tax=hydrocarbon metagenome TaxID=938273 RepID=A0A0W8F1Z7_9ZZZZ
MKGEDKPLIPRQPQGTQKTYAVTFPGLCSAFATRPVKERESWNNID